MQNAIRDAINRRYDLMHYLYTSFYYASITGAPVMRPVWFDFSEEPQFYNVETEFMFGSNILVAPKVKMPTSPLESVHKQEVTFTLPVGATWYNFYNKLAETVRGEAITRTLPDLEQAVFVKGGSVVPILEHDECLAITECFHGQYRLEVYLDQDQKASGTMFFDDGASFKYQSEEAYTIIEYTFEQVDVIYLQATRLTTTEYTFPETQTVKSVEVYGWTTQPTEVMQGGIQCEFSFNQAEASLLIAMP